MRHVSSISEERVRNMSNNGTRQFAISKQDDDEPKWEGQMCDVT